MVSSTSLILASSPPSWAALASSTRSFRSYASSSAAGTRGDREEHRSAWPPSPPPPESPPRPHLAAAAACPGHPAAARQPRPAAAVPGCPPAARPAPGAPPAPAPCGTGPAAAPPAPDRQQDGQWDPRRTPTPDPHTHPPLPTCLASPARSRAVLAASWARVAARLLLARFTFRASVCPSRSPICPMASASCCSALAVCACIWGAVARGAGTIRERTQRGRVPARL